MLEPFTVLADAVANVVLLLVKLNVVLILQTTIVETDVMSLGAKMSCGPLLDYVHGVIKPMCM